MDIESALVDEIATGELRGQMGASEDGGAPGSCLEIQNFSRQHVIADRVASVGLVDGSRVDDFGHVPPDRGELSHVGRCTRVSGQRWMGRLESRRGS